jgi:hypothetical protein
MSCAQCGASSFKAPDKPTRDSVVVCGACGCRLGTVAEIEAAGKNAQRLLGKNPSKEKVREALLQAFGHIKTIRVE